MKCNIITPQAAMGPTMKALADGHRASDCPKCKPLQYGEEKGACQEAAPWPPGRSGDEKEPGVGA